MNEPWRIQLFGGLRASQSGRTIARFRTQKTGGLLAYLAYHLGHSQPRETLIDMFWPDSEAESGRHSLSLALSSLRSQLEPPGATSGTVIVADRYSVELNPDSVRTDVQEFEQALRSAAQARSTPSYIPLLEQATERYGGPLLPGYYDDWIPQQQERLSQRYFQTVLQLISPQEATARSDRSLEIAQRAVAIDPTREDVARELMRLMASSGQRESALRVYSELVAVLERELGEEPSDATRKIAREIQTKPAPVAAQLPLPERLRAAQTELPTGTVTFLLSDIEGSTAQWERAGEAFRAALLTHHAIIRNEIRRNGGQEVKEAGDSFLIAFSAAGDALACAIACQRALVSQPWPEAVEALRVRMALHTGDVELHDGEYHGLLLHHASRMLAAAHGGQIVCSEATAALVRRDLEPELNLKDLGVYRLRDVAHPERLVQVSYAGMPQPDFPPLEAEPAHAARIPIQFTRFFGRETELERLHEILKPDSGVRLITLTGPGGTGKTRLAIEAANRVAESFSGAVTFATFADLSDASQLPGKVLEARGVPQNAAEQPIAQLAKAFGREPHLLILDNLEHVAEAGAEFIQILFERIPSLSILVTSRQVMGLPGEQEFPVPPLSIPDSTGTLEQLGMFDSVRLFVDRAQAVKPDFRVTNSNAPAVSELCSRLEGLPLAIELAAARAQVMTPAQMLDQLAHRFAFLVTRKRGVAERQRTLRAAIDWSYRLLCPELQRFFLQLSAFRGGWTVEAAESVSREALTLDHLAQLRESSLVLTEESVAGMRFTMLEMLREYACEQLNEEEKETVNRRHAEHYLAIAETGAGELRGERQSEWLERLELDHSNFRAALQWSLESSEANQEGSASSLNSQLSTLNSLQLGLRLAGALSRFWSIRGHARQARPIIERLLEAATSRPALNDSADRAAALDAAGSLAHDMGHLQSAAEYLKSSLYIWRSLGEATKQAYTLNLTGNVALDSGDQSAALPLYQDALSLYRSLGDQRGTAMVLSNLTVVALQAGDLERAADLAEENLALKRHLANPHGLASALENLGNIRMRIGDLEEARDLHNEALTIRREIGHRQGVAMSLNNLGHVLLTLGDLDAAATRLSESITLFHDLGDYRALAEALEGAAGVLIGRGQDVSGGNLLGAAGVFAGDTPEDPESMNRMSQLIKGMETSLGAKKLARALTTGRAWTPGESVERARGFLSVESA